MAKMIYTDLVYNLAQAVKAWKVVTGILAALTVCSLYGMVFLATHQTVVLVPQNIAAAKGSVKVSTASGWSDAYLGFIAEADLATVLNWTPDDVTLQYTRFLNRVTPDFYALQQVSLLADAVDHAKASEIQSFYPLSAKLVAADTITIHGTLSRWVGDKQVFHQPVEYTLTYVAGSGGLPYVSSLTTTK